MDVQGFVAAGFEPVRECFAEILGRQSGTVGSHDRADALENTLRGCLGVPSLTATGAE